MLPQEHTSNTLLIIGHVIAALPLPPSPHAKSFVIGTSVTNTHTLQMIHDAALEGIIPTYGETWSRETWSLVANTLGAR